MKRKDPKKHTITKTEHDYLKKLEAAVIGKNSDNFYVAKSQDNKKIEQLERLRRVWETPPENGLPEKEPPRISIESIVGEEQESRETRESQESQESQETQESPPAEEKLSHPGVPIELVIQEIAPLPQEIPPAPQEPLQPPPRILKPGPPVSQKPEPEPPSSQADLLFEMGTIILLGDGSIGIYKGSIPGKEYQLIYHLRPDGTVTPEGIYLHAYRCETLGCLNSEALEEMQRSMRWERDRIVERLSSEEKVRLIPLLSSKAIKMEVSEPPRNRDSLERGRLLKVRIGDRIWEGVYWGSDELGQIVAHNTNKVWTLMHLNLGRFGDALEYGALLSQDQMKNINLSLTESMSVGD